MASQWDPSSVCGSQLTIIVQGCVMECGKRSVGQTPRNVLTPRRVHRICNVSIISQLQLVYHLSGQFVVR